MYSSLLITIPSSAITSAPSQQFILIAKELTAEGMPEDSTEGRREIRSETRLQSPHFPQPSIEKALFAFVCDQRERAFITPSRVTRRALPAQKIRARGVKQMIVFKFARRGQRINQPQRRAGCSGHRNRHGSIQRNDRRRLRPFE